MKIAREIDREYGHQLSTPFWEFPSYKYMYDIVYDVLINQKLSTPFWEFQTVKTISTAIMMYQLSTPFWEFH